MLLQGNRTLHPEIFTFQSVILYHSIMKRHNFYWPKSEKILESFYNIIIHGLRTPNEGINQIYLKNWANVADKKCFSPT